MSPLDTSIVLVEPVSNVDCDKLPVEVKVSLAVDIARGLAADEARYFGRDSISFILGIGFARIKGMLTSHEISIIARCIFRERHETDKVFTVIQLQVGPMRS